MYSCMMETIYHHRQMTIPMIAKSQSFILYCGYLYTRPVRASLHDYPRKMIFDGFKSGSCGNWTTGRGRLAVVLYRSTLKAMQSKYAAF